MSKKNEVKSNNIVGRPPLYKTAEELQKKISQYFKSGVKKKVSWQGDKKIIIPIPTITGLILYCGFCNRASFYDLEKNPLFTHTIKKARSFIEKEYEELLHSGSCTGAIFALKNFGWIDKSEVEHTGAIGLLTKEEIDARDTRIRQAHNLAG